MTTVWLRAIVVPGAFGKILPEAVLHSSSCALDAFGVRFGGVAGVSVVQIGARRELPKKSVCLHGVTLAGFCVTFSYDSGSLVITLGIRSGAMEAPAAPTWAVRDRMPQLHSAAIGSGKTMNQCSSTPSAINDASSV